MTGEKERREAVHMNKHERENGVEMRGVEMRGGRDLGERALRIATKFAIYRAQYQKRIAQLVLDERGDVPGWVLVVLMTTGLVTGIWTVAAPRIESLLRGSLDAMNNVH